MPSSLPGRSATEVHVSRSVVQSLIVETTPTFSSGNLRGALGTEGMATARLQVFLYPQYATGLSTYLARNYITWRVLGVAAGQRPVAYTGLTTVSAMPLTPPQLLPVGIPVNVQIPSAGFEVIYIEFDTSGGVAGPDQGQDLIVLTLTAAA